MKKEAIKKRGTSGEWLDYYSRYQFVEHYRKRIEELEFVLMYVMEGSFLIQYKNELINEVKGMVLKLEKCVEHLYKKVGNEIGKLLITYTPAGIENYFRELDSLLKTMTSSSIADNLQILNKEDDRIILHNLEKNYGWTFGS